MALERRRAVIMSADLVGYTRLMEQDDVGTWAQLRALRKEIIDPTLAANSGNIFKSMGDGILVEFANCVDAVQASVGVQTAVRNRYEAAPASQRLQFRVGIDAGDAIADNDDLFGDAVNVAARLQGVCEPGGLCISETVFSAIGESSEISFEDIGLIELRNRAEPVHSYVWRNGAVAEIGQPWHTLPGIKPQAGMSNRTIKPRKPSALPSVAVLPFDNFSDDDELGYFCSGIAEDITTELYRFKSFSVISRTSSFMYSGEGKAAQEIGAELGAGYVLEGSIRKLGSRVRIAAQLIDVNENDHVWADRFDIELAKIFDAQDQIVAQIVATLGDGIERHRLEKSKHLAPSELEAYELMLRGLEMHKQGYVSYEEAVKIYNLFSEAVEKDPNLARARAWKVCAGSRLWPAQADPVVFDSHVDDALDELRLVLKLNDEEPEAHRMFGAIWLFRRDFDRARFHIEKALTNNPNNAHLLAKSANFYSYFGDPKKALELLARAVTINPHHPDWYWQEYGLACWADEDYVGAAEHLIKSATQADFDHAYLAAVHIELGNGALAEQNARRFMAINSDTTADMFAERQPFRLEEMRTRLSRQLHSAGLP